ncbi:MAG: DUF1697 domain-containing protein [Acidobacteriota bacterium]|nr:DUF1697 domain-containing protein [Acidobacteriota bacterium]
MKYIALLRGINVGGNKKVAMADLLALLKRLGFDDARTLLQSGNLVFRTTRKTAAQLERQLEAEVLKTIGLETKFFVRSEEEWKAVIDANPYPNEAKCDPAHLLVLFLERAPEGENLKALQAAIKGRETFRAGGRHLYMVYPDGVGTSKLTHAVIEKKLGMRGTARNWNTVSKLA